MERGGALGVAAFVAQLPGVLAAKGWLEDAYAQSGDVVVETLSGLVAFILPGDDPVLGGPGDEDRRARRHRGRHGAGLHPQPRRVRAGCRSRASGTETLPASGGVAMLLNRYALEVNPAAGEGDAISPFARLTFDEKAEVMRLFEADPLWDDTEFKFVVGDPARLRRVPGVVRGRRDRPRHARADETRPVGWKLAKFDGPAEGHPEFRGYYRGHKLGEEAQASPACVT